MVARRDAGRHALQTGGLDNQLRAMPAAVSSHIVLLALWSSTALLGAGAKPAMGTRPTVAVAIPINLRCTTCDDFIQCQQPDAQPDSLTSRTPNILYRLKEKTFWAQIATIGDYLTQLFRAKTTDLRPLAIYRDTGRDRAIETNPRWRASIDSTQGRITLPDARISQLDGSWWAPDGTRLGQCQALTRRNGYGVVREFLGKPALATAGSR